MKYAAECLWILILCIVAIPGESNAEPETRTSASLVIPMVKINNLITTGAGEGKLNQKLRECSKYSYSDPCAKYDRIIDDQDIRESFHRLWLASETDRPVEQRSEQGGWIVSNGKKQYKLIPFPSSWPRFSCGIDIPGDFLESLPDNLVGVAHTHPFYNGDDTTAPDVCGEEGLETYESGGNKYDLDLLIQIANHLSDYCIRGFVIDGDNIISMDVWSKMFFYPTGIFFRPAAS